jgi:hypothetical protein
MKPEYDGLQKQEIQIIESVRQALRPESVRYSAMLGRLARFHYEESW